jgi:uncharacterized protein
MADREPEVLPGRQLLGGRASGSALVLDEPLSMWGGLDLRDGRIIDRHHPQHGRSVRGRVLVMPHGRGSSSSSSVLAEALRLGVGPAAIVLAEADQIVVLGALVAELVDGILCPVVVLEAADYRRLRPDADVTVDGGMVAITSPGEVT